MCCMNTHKKNKVVDTILNFLLVVIPVVFLVSLYWCSKPTSVDNKTNEINRANITVTTGEHIVESNMNIDIDTVATLIDAYSWSNTIKTDIQPKKKVEEKNTEKEEIKVVQKKSQSYRIHDTTPSKKELFEWKGGSERYSQEFPIEQVRIVHYSQKRDLEDRDVIDVKKVSEEYVNRTVAKHRKIITMNNGFTYYKTASTVKPEDVKLILLYMHGAGWNKTWWIKDETFGWNFNRVQDLMIQNKWVYISTTVEWNKRWVQQHMNMLQNLHKEYPNAQFILSAGSKWGEMLKMLISAFKRESFKPIGIMLLGSIYNSSVVPDISLVKQWNMPIYQAHGMKDKNIPYKWKINDMRIMKQAWLEHMMKVELFDNWVHGTPIRMLIWQDALNWILETREKLVKNK